MKTKSGTSKKHSAHAKHTMAKAGKSSKTYYVVCVEQKGAQWFCEEEALNVYLNTLTDLYTVKEYRTSQTALKKCKEFNMKCKGPSSGKRTIHSLLLLPVVAACFLWMIASQSYLRPAQKENKVLALLLKFQSLPVKVVS